MKTIVQFSLAALLILAGGACAEAQNNNGPRDGRGRDPKEMADRQTTRMTETLKLTATQQASVKTINLKFAEQMKQLRDANPTADRATLRPKMDALRTQHQAELGQVLTAEQRDMWEKQKAERGKGHKGGKGGQGGKPWGVDGPGGDKSATPEQRADRQTQRMTQKLQLTEAQQKKVRDINLKYAKQTEKDREKMKSTRQKQAAELNAVLTPEQKATWEKEHPGKKGKKGKRGRTQE